MCESESSTRALLLPEDRAHSLSLSLSLSLCVCVCVCVCVCMRACARAQDRGSKVLPMLSPSKIVAMGKALLES